MTEHPIQGLMKTAMESIKGMVDVDTVVGSPVETQDGTVIIPVSRVAFGFAAGGGEYGNVDQHHPASDHPFGGGTGAGVSVQPMGFLVVGHNSVRVLPMDGGQPLERIIDMAPQVIEMLRNAARSDNLGRPNTAVPGKRTETGPDIDVPRTTVQ